MRNHPIPVVTGFGIDRAFKNGDAGDGGCHLACDVLRLCRGVTKECRARTEISPVSLERDDDVCWLIGHGADSPTVSPCNASCASCNDAQEGAA